MEELHINVWVASFIGAFIVLLLGVIGYFLSRIVNQFDELNKAVQKIDRDLSGDMGVLRTRVDSLRVDLDETHPLWDRIRNVENNLIEIRAACKRGCGK